MGCQIFRVRNFRYVESDSPVKTAGYPCTSVIRQGCGMAQQIPVMMKRIDRIRMRVLFVRKKIHSGPCCRFFRFGQRISQRDLGRAGYSVFYHPGQRWRKQQLETVGIVIQIQILAERRRFQRIDAGGQSMMAAGICRK